MDEIMTCDRCGNQFVGELLTEEMKIHDIPDLSLLGLRRKKMADAKKCDKCQSFYNAPAQNEDVMIDGQYASRIKIGLLDTLMVKKDLCPSCAMAFVNWFYN